MGTGEFPVGPELDAAVAAALGWQCAGDDLSLAMQAIGAPPYYVRPDGVVVGLTRFSEKIAAAWQVLERLEAEGWAFSIDYINGPGFYDVHIYPSRDMETWKLGRAKSAPHAICLAALAALEAP